MQHWFWQMTTSYLLLSYFKILILALKNFFLSTNKNFNKLWLNGPSPCQAANNTYNCSNIVPYINEHRLDTTKWQVGNLQDILSIFKSQKFSQCRINLILFYKFMFLTTFKYASCVLDQPHVVESIGQIQNQPKW